MSAGHEHGTSGTRTWGLLPVAGSRGRSMDSVRPPSGRYQRPMGQRDWMARILRPMPPAAVTPGSPELAAFGAALRAARLRAGLTQTDLAGERYRKAFISALEHGQSRPSVPALEYLARRLGLGPADLLGEGHASWDRLEADLRLAGGDWRAALDAYDDLLAGDVAPQRRAELLRGRAEALSRLGRHAEAIPAASEAAAIFEAAGRAADAALARYWQASGLYWLENPRDARAVLEAVLAAVRNGLAVEPGFEARVLIALAMVDGREGDAERALTYLHEARGRLSQLDDRRRASFLQSLAISYREAGDLEAALRLGWEALAYFEAAASQLDVAVLENELALNFLARGSLHQAEEHAAAAEARLGALGERTVLAHVLETQAADRKSVV